jgi:hypothetical protein
MDNPTELSEILPQRLYLSSVHCRLAEDAPELLKNISVVVDLSAQPDLPRIVNEVNISYCAFPDVDDNKGYDLLPIMQEVCRLCEDRWTAAAVVGAAAAAAAAGGSEGKEEEETTTQMASQGGGAAAAAAERGRRAPVQQKVLVHCQQGASRSAAVVMYVLMKTQGMSLRDAFRLAKARRRVVLPNLGFM